MTPDQQQARRADVTTPSEREIRVERVFDAPRDLVWSLYTEPELIPEWWGPEEHKVLVDRMDVRTGGFWRFVPADPDSGDHAFRGAYREVTPPERIVQSFEWEGMPGRVSIETCTFEDLGEQTRVVTVSLFHSTEERDGMLGSGMEWGLNETYRRLDELIEKRR
jgi:uncharacterized protein YndB with AHSA1/START domain